MQRLLRLALLPLVLLALAWPATAVAEDAPFVGWSSLLPGLSLPYDVDSPNDCIAGRVQCVDKVIRQMTTRFEPLASSCDHDAIFALTYLRVTEEYRRTIETPTFFDDTSFVNHEDVLFARYYFAAYDAWAAGRTASVPPAWRVAFDAARDRAVSANGICSSASTHTSSATSRSSFTASGSSSRTAPAGRPTTIG